MDNTVAKNLYVFIDESGNLGTSGRYFVISAVYCKNYKKAHRFMKNRITKAKNTFPKMRCSINEIKSVNAYPCVKHKILYDLSNREFSVSYIVLDLFHIDAHLLENKNLLYNFATKI